MAIDLHEYKKLYLQTSQDLLSTIYQNMAELNKDRHNEDALTELHRAAHSLKSQSLVMGYTQIGLAGKILEALFLNTKKENVEMSDELIHHINTTLDALTESLANIRANHGEKNIAVHIAALEANTAIKLLD